MRDVIPHILGIDEWLHLADLAIDGLVIKPGNSLRSTCFFAVLDDNLASFSSFSILDEVHIIKLTCN